MRVWYGMFLAPVVVALLLPACSKPDKPKLGSAYVFEGIQLEFPDRKHFKITFDPQTKWGQFGPLEGETTEFGSFFALLPKTLNGMSEEKISQEALRMAQTQGIQVDLMAVGVLMRRVKMEIGDAGTKLTVTDPPYNDPDKHPLAGAVFSSGL